MTRPCGRHVVGRGLCAYDRMKGKQQCVWHWLLKQPAQIQKACAVQRLAEYDGSWAAHVAEGRQDRVHKSRWPDGERWCSGCQSFVPLFYVTGSRCKACASSASHEAMVAKTYGLGPGEYDALFAQQGGRCFICQRRSPSRRLAVDHDHVTGAVRGLLCPDPDRGCNHAILGPLEASPGGALAAARRMVLYLEVTPYERLHGKDAPTWAEYCAQQAQAASEAAQSPSSGPTVTKPPF